VSGLEHEDRFHILLQNIPSIAIQGYRLDGTTTFWNKASERLYGYTAQEAIGRNLLDLIIPSEMKDGVRAAIKQMAETGECIPGAELSLMAKDGSRVNVFSNHALINIPNSPLELFCLDIDLSDRRRMEEELIRINKYLTNRELKMVELKKKIKELEKKIKS
jgi:PAS domain S-box-containing protein